MNITREQLESQITTLEERLGKWDCMPNPTPFARQKISHLTADISAMKMRLEIMRLTDVYRGYLECEDTMPVRNVIADLEKILAD